jgi:hypothetical protein
MSDGEYMKYIILRDDTFILYDKHGQEIYRRYVDKPLHHVTYKKVKHGWHVEEFEVIREPDSNGFTNNLLFPIRESLKVREFDLVI